MQCPRQGWWLTQKCCGEMQGKAVWWWQSLVLTACSRYTTVHGSSEGCGSSPGPVLNKESLLLTPPMPAFSAFFTLLPFHTTTSLWALPFQSPALPRAPYHSPRGALQLQLARTSCWRKHWGRGSQGVPEAEGQPILQVSFGDLWEPVKLASCRHGARNGRVLLVSASSPFVTGAWPSLLTSRQGCKWDGDFDLEHLEL